MNICVFFIKIKYVNLLQNLVIEKEMKIAVERLSWKEIFDKTEQNRKKLVQKRKKS